MIKVNDMIEKVRHVLAPRAPGRAENDYIQEYYHPPLGLELAPYIQVDDMQGIHHVARYQWAVAVLTKRAPRRVLDVACGAGYGSYMLAQHLPEARILGVDYDIHAVEIARASYQQANLEYLVGDLVAWAQGTGNGASPLGVFDVIVSFDTLEHLDHREIALIRITENLAGDGLLLLSTPCGHEETLLHPPWAAHKVEYGFRDLQNLLRRYFEVVLLPEDGTLPELNYWTDIVNKDKQRYLNITNPVVCARPIRVP